MKKLSTTIVIALFGIACLFAQSGNMTDYEVVEAPEWMGQKAENAYLLAVDTDQKLALDSWARQMDEQGFPTYIVDANQPVLLTEGALIPEISSEKMDIYIQSEYNGQDDGTKLIFWFRLPDGSFISSKNQPSSFSAISEYLLDFGQQAKRNLKATIYFENLQIAENRYPPTSGSSN